MQSRLIQQPECNDTRKCFAANYKNGRRYCLILETTYEHDEECRFCKSDEADIINAKYHRMIHENGLRYRQVAACIGISPEMLSSIMSKPLSERNIVRIKQAIKELTREKNKWTKNITQ